MIRQFLGVLVVSVIVFMTIAFLFGNGGAVGYFFHWWGWFLIVLLGAVHKFLLKRPYPTIAVISIASAIGIGIVLRTGGYIGRGFISGSGFYLTAYCVNLIAVAWSFSALNTVNSAIKSCLMKISTSLGWGRYGYWLLSFCAAFACVVTYFLIVDYIYLPWSRGWWG